MTKKIAFLFPGQGAQYVGMGRDFFDAFNLVRETFEEANDLLGFDLTKIVLEGPQEKLTETRNSQAGIFVLSTALLRLIQHKFKLNPTFCSGLSLGEYSALYASDKLDFNNTLQLVSYRGQYMNEACEARPGTMAVVLGLEARAVSEVVRQAQLPNDLWVANYNCPGQVVISGTLKGIEAGKQLALEKGAKRVLPLQVHGAFHSGLMKMAEEKFAPHVEAVHLKESPIELVMNVTGEAVKSELKQQLIKQITNSVRWEQGVRHMLAKGVDLFIEIGCGKTLSGFNKRIDANATTISVEKVEELDLLEKVL